MSQHQPDVTDGKRVGIWIRVSTADQAKGESPEHHEARGRMYAEAKGWTVVTVYHLEGISGKTVMDLPETKRMLADIASGTITGLIFSKLARFARNTRELLEFADIFRREGADLISLQESIDTSTAAGRHFFRNIASAAEWEREETAERVAASVPIRAKLGKRISGAAPFGYAWVEGKLIPDETEAPIRRLMYELFRQHRRVKTVARLLTERGYRTRRGEDWNATSVRRLLLDPTAKGVRRANYSKSLGDGKAWTWKPESDWVLVPVPPIVDEALWAECVALLEERRNGRKKPGRRPVHLFTGVVFCECGRKMYVPSNSPKWTCYGCRNKIPVGDLEAVFAEQLKSFVFSSEAIGEHLEAADAEIRTKRELLTTLEAERQSAVSEQEKLYQLYLAGGLTVSGFRERNDPLEARRVQLATEVPRLQGEVDFLTIRLLSSSEVLEEAQDLYARWTTLPFEAKREIVETIVERIAVGKGEVEISFTTAPPHPPIPPSPEGLTERDRIHRDWPRQEGRSGRGT